MTPITTHLRGGEHVTIIRAPGDPMPAWLGGGCPEERNPWGVRWDQPSDKFVGDPYSPIDALHVVSRMFGEDITLPPLEGQA